MHPRTAVALNRGLLADSRAASARLALPAYHRADVRVGIVHVGVGGFHRSHQAMYLDRLMNDGQALGWGICGVGVLPSDRRMADVLTAQDGLYTLVVRDWTGGTTARVIGSVVGYLFAPDDPDAVVERMAHPETRMVSLTVTEGGYNLDPSTGQFDADDESVQADLRGTGPPRTMFGLVTEALRRRREREIAPFAVVSCDNVEHNGSVAERSIAGFADLLDPALAAWIREEVRFPSSMVDRITPATTDEDRRAFAAEYGVADQWPVFCEPFTQWILADVLPADARPPLEHAGVQLVADVAPYELMKLRLLNAGHQAIGYLGFLAGYDYVHEVCADPVFADFLHAYLDEVTPTLPAVPGVDLAGYKHELVIRFTNPGVGDRLERICAFSSDRMPKFVLPALADNVRAGRSIRAAVLVVAAWARYVAAVAGGADGSALLDSQRDRLVANARADDPLAFVDDRRFFGELPDSDEFRAAYLQAQRSLGDHGPRGAAERVARQ